MGCCYCKLKQDKVISYMFIKMPHGKKYIIYDDKNNIFEEKEDINKWLNEIYKMNEWKKWIIYNDEEPNGQCKGKGHCKGIIAWNNKRISWLCHSVPTFPKSTDLLEIGESELIYGQSFQYIEIQYDDLKLQEIIEQIHIMEANVYLTVNYEYQHSTKETKTKPKLKVIEITDTIVHIAKSPHNEIDIYGDYIALNTKWQVETWLRGHKLNETTKNIIDIKKLKFKEIQYNESQDHSKWGVSENDEYWVGDLNRMETQKKRGGGGFLCKNKNISRELKNLIFA